MTDVTIEAAWKAYGERLLAVAERSKGRLQRRTARHLPL